MEVNNGQTKFSMLVCDYDKYLYLAAKDVQNLYVIVRKGDVEERYDNVTQFKEAHPEDHKEWEVLQMQELKEDVDDPLEEAKRHFACNVSHIKNLPYARRYKLCIGGEGNFRYDVAKTWPYKGKRPEKPILYSELKEAVIKQYKNHIDLCDGYEADDRLGMYAGKNYQHFKKTGEWLYLLAYQDKDLDQLAGPHITLGSTGEGIKWITPEDGCRAFCRQMLKGDKQVDNIPGIRNLTDEIKEKYSLRKGRGVGDKAAETIINDSLGLQEMVERVVECYKSSYPEPFSFLSHDGNEYTWTWREYMNEQARLLWMLRSTNTEWDIFSGLVDKICK